MYQQGTKTSQIKDPALLFSLRKKTRKHPNKQQQQQQA